MPSLEWIDGTSAHPDDKGVKIIQSDGTEVILEKYDCFYFGSKKTIARFSGCTFNGRTSMIFSELGYANPPQSIIYVTSKNLNGRSPVKVGKILLKNTKLLDSIKKSKCSHEVPLGLLGGQTRHHRSTKHRKTKRR